MFEGLEFCELRRFYFFFPEPFFFRFFSPSLITIPENGFVVSLLSMLLLILRIRRHAGSAAQGGN
jgi:hypothetical protein